MNEYSGLTAVGYYRVSTDDKDQTTMHQEREVKKYCKDNEINLIASFSDDLSGGDTNRPGLQQLMGFLIFNRVGLLIVRSVSRLSRDPDELPAIRKNILATGVKILYLDSKVDPDTDAGALVTDIEARISGIERKHISRNTTVAMATKKAQGIHCGRHPACVLEHNVNRDIKKITDKEGKIKSKIIPYSVILDAANDGLSTSVLARSLAIGRTALESMLAEDDILSTYQNVSRTARNNRRKGLPSERVNSLYPNVEKTQSSDVVVKGTLSNNTDNPFEHMTNNGGGA